MAQTLPNGVVVPNADGGEQISATGVAEMRTLGSSVDTALGSKADTSYVDERAWDRGRVPTSTTDVLTLDAGAWTVPFAGWTTTLVNFPPGEFGYGVFKVATNAGENWKEITYHPVGRAYYWRTVSSTGGGMEPWQRWDQPYPLYGGQLADGSNWDTLYAPRTYQVSGSGSLADRGHTGFPPDATTNGTLTVKNGVKPGVNPWASQMFEQFGTNPGIWWRITRSAIHGQWNDWVLLTHDDYGHNSGQTNDILKEQFTLRRGGAIGIGNKAAVSFRFDHGLNNFNDIVLPLLEQYGFPSSQAYFTDMFGDSAYTGEDDQRSWADVREWAATKGVEPTSHSHTHGMVYGRAAIEQQIKGSKAILATEVPGSVVETYTVPGGGSNYFPGGGAPEDFYGSMAGRMILDTYAVSSGYLGGNIRTIDGTIRQGLRHVTLDDAANAAAAYSAIDRAVATRGGLVLMMHPSRIGYGEGYTTAAELEALMAYVAGLRDEGLIEVMTLSGITVANSGSTRRLNLALGGNFPADWSTRFTNTSGWSRGTSNGIAYVETSTGLTLNQSIAPGWTRPHRGIVMQVVAKVRSPDGGTARIGSTTAGVLHDVAVGTDWREIRAFVTMPEDGGGNFVVNVGRVSGTIQVADFRFEPV